MLLIVIVLKTLSIQKGITLSNSRDICHFLLIIISQNIQSKDKSIDKIYDKFIM